MERPEAMTGWRVIWTSTTDLGVTTYSTTFSDEAKAERFARSKAEEADADGREERVVIEHGTYPTSEWDEGRRVESVELYDEDDDGEEG